MHRKGLWETSPSRVYAHGGMTVISREHVKQVCNLNSWKPRMLFQKAPWTKPGLQSQPYWLSVVDLWGKTHPKFHFSEVRRRIQISSSALLCAQRLAPVVCIARSSELPALWIPLRKAQTGDQSVEGERSGYFIQPPSHPCSTISRSSLFLLGEGRDFVLNLALPGFQ